MSDCLTRELSAQLTIKMDVIIRKSVSEVIQFFEKSVHDYRMELAKKEKEITLLKMKLRMAEVSKKRLPGSDKERTSELPNHTIQPDAATDSSGQPPETSGVAVLASEDGISPLGDETTTKKDERKSSSIKLRQLVIPLKQSSVGQAQKNGDNDLELTPGVQRNCVTVSTSKDIQKSNQTDGIQVAEQKPNPERCDTQTPLQGVEQESDSTISKKLRKKKRILTGEEKEPVKKVRKEMSVNKVKNNCKCITCNAVFDTKRQLRKHEKVHLVCKYCEKTFNFPSDLRRHGGNCRNKTSVLQEPSSSEPQTPSPSIKPFIIKLSRTTDKPNQYSFLSQGNKSPGKQRSNFHEKPFSCEFCPMKFKFNHRLRTHILQAHKLTQITEDFAWTRPVEEIDDSIGD